MADKSHQKKYIAVFLKNNTKFIYFITERAQDALYLMRMLPSAGYIIIRCSAASSAPRVIHRSAACQTFAPACDPLVVEQIAKMKQEALRLEESLAEARAETTEVRCILDGARAAFAEDLAQARADNASVRQTMVVALSKEAEVTSGLKLELQLQQEQVEGLKSALERSEGSLAAAKLDLGILERKHSRAVESMVEYRYGDLDDCGIVRRLLAC